MTNSAATAIFALALAVILLVSSAAARPQYGASIPNGYGVHRNGVLWPAVGHTSSSSGTARNAFGLAFASAGLTWTPALCNADSDGDGFTNGQELGDPDCVWTVGDTPARTTDISHPGFSDSIPANTAPALTDLPTSTLPPSTIPGTISPPPSPTPVPIPLPTSAVAEFTGILADRLCVDGIIAADGANMITNPEDHSVKCALMPPCIESGYTILGPSLAGPPATYGTMYNLTAKGNEMAVAFLRSLPDDRKNLRVSVQGFTDANGVLHLVSLALQDIGLSTAVSHTFEGFVVDRLCVDGIIAFDGTNMMERPQDHSAKCLLMPQCVASGFALLLEKRPNPMTGMKEPGYGAMYNLTLTGTNELKTWAETLHPERRSLKVRFEGFVSSTGVITQIVTSTLMPLRRKYRGILADRLCVDGIIAADGANMITNPEDHSVKCALMPPCIESGYTILTKPDPHSGPATDYGLMFNLSESANQMAVAFLRSLPEWRKNLELTAYGDLDAMGHVVLDQLYFQDVGRDTEEEQTFQGYLVDRLCLDIVNAPDGANMMEGPQNHTAMCMMLPQCQASGWAMLLHKHPNANGTFDPGYGAIYNFTNDTSISLVDNWIAALPGATNNLEVTVVAKVDKEGRIYDVSSITPGIIATPAPVALPPPTPSQGAQTPAPVFTNTNLRLLDFTFSSLVVNINDEIGSCRRSGASCQASPNPALLGPSGVPDPDVERRATFEDVEIAKVLLFDYLSNMFAACGCTNGSDTVLVMEQGRIPETTASVNSALMDRVRSAIIIAGDLCGCMITPVPPTTAPNSTGSGPVTPIPNPTLTPLPSGTDSPDDGRSTPAPGNNLDGRSATPADDDGEGTKTAVITISIICVILVVGFAAFVIYRCSTKSSSKRKHVPPPQQQNYGDADDFSGAATSGSPAAVPAAREPSGKYVHDPEGGLEMDEDFDALGQDDDLAGPPTTGGRGASGMQQVVAQKGAAQQWQRNAKNKNQARVATEESLVIEAEAAAARREVIAKEDRRRQQEALERAKAQRKGSPQQTNLDMPPESHQQMALDVAADATMREKRVEGERARQQAKIAQKAAEAKAKRSPNVTPPPEDHEV